MTGTGESGVVVYVDFYASDDAQITPSDHYLGQVSLGLSVNSWTMIALHSTLPPDVPGGTYFVGWIIDPGNINVETNEDNNVAYIASVKLVVIGGSSPAPSTFYVDTHAQGSNDGSSWDDAYPHLQDALGAATKGCEIRVADGTYRPDRGGNASRGDRGAAFEIKSRVTILGGYAGAGAANPNARDVQVYPTILSGDLNGDDSPVVDSQGLWRDVSRLDNSLHVVTARDVAAGTLLDGVHIVGGCADGWFEVGAEPRDSQGAGMYVSGGTLRLRGCTISGNWAATGGAGLYATAGQVELLDCTLVGNAAGLGIDEGQGTGGAIHFASGNLTLTSCTISGNQSSGTGGALEIGPRTSLFAANCCLHANHAAVQAGAMHAMDSRAHLVNCTLVGNRQGSGSDAIVWEASGSPADGELQIANSILWNEGCEIATVEGLVVTVTYSDVWGRRWPGAGNIDADPQFVDVAGPDGAVGTADDDLRPRPNSPCIDAGDLTSLTKDITDLDSDGDVTEMLPLDRDGQERVIGIAVDMGAYEAQPADIPFLRAFRGGLLKQ